MRIHAVSFGGRIARDGFEVDCQIRENADPYSLKGGPLRDNHQKNRCHLDGATLTRYQNFRRHIRPR